MIDFSDTALRYAWLRHQATSHRGTALGDGGTVAAEVLSRIEGVNAAPVGADLLHGVALLADRSVTVEFESWQRSNFEAPTGPLPWQLIAEAVESDAGPMISVFKNVDLGVWMATPRQSIANDRAPVWSLKSGPGGKVTRTAFLSFPSVWGWLWTRFFSSVPVSGFSIRDILGDEVEDILEAAPSEFGPARFEYENEVFFLGDGVSLYLAEMGGEWMSHLVIDRADADFVLSDAFLSLMNCSRPTIGRALERRRTTKL